MLYLLVPLSLGLAALVVWALLWAVRTGQFEDLEGAAHRILRDDDRPAEAPPGATREACERDSGGARSSQREDSTSVEDARRPGSD